MKALRLDKVIIHHVATYSSLLLFFLVAKYFLIPDAIQNESIASLVFTVFVYLMSHFCALKGRTLTDKTPYFIAVAQYTVILVLVVLLPLLIIKAVF